ncbi:AmmeMemoRadiSam system protein A [Schwartzia succinivorans]|jgi:AmmeMemoRadiSam system protein A/AmmeMemoRadiSam system protein B|uniref:Uncharacterized protein, PH0010 family/AmmeMemoRadiSam system protein A/AmmeMemoRadiSam system protein B n=1 Tax=Schwartzia succinivorans DSM 10502 TaxID=1123243 RepID=A0A1M4XT47_9FIRM|nr:AmmeMemoRadiSam system protein A [Schwartzia succinivorans]SHE96651.1 uncharacterized protein, PH0010 family/AmmeMemoRadiSam system protein A/AmmeMemoRadiSam system protein B [Schwartzia succinivorans DSM 10502]
MAILGAAAVPHPPIILPEVGKGEERKIQRTIDAYREAMRRLAELKPDTVILSSPHATMYADYFQVSPGYGAEGDFSAFRAPEVRVSVQYDKEFVELLEKNCRDALLAAGTLGERVPRLDHGTMIPIRFLQEFWSDFRLVRVGLSGMSPAEHYAFGECIARTAALLGRRAVYIASGDLSHKLKTDGPYGFAEEGPVFDKECTEALGCADFTRLLSIDSELAEGAAECGLRSFWIMAGALDRHTVKAELLSYEGTFGVGYGVVSFEPGGRDDGRNCGEQFEKQEKERLAKLRAAEDIYVKLARYSLETFVRTGEHAAFPDRLPDELTKRKAGVFVSLKKDGRLRGCIGTFLPREDSIAKEILHNAVSACSEDPRFSPVRKSELDSLVYSVDVLTEPELTDEDGLDVKRYGVIVEAEDGRRGLLLPDLAGIDTVEEQISIAAQKGNIRPDEKVRYWRFEVVRHR